ncbi:MAG: FHA domain-containing protein [Candidatus Sericytochromatia bacterium]|nr:FHA domain-containing protein [Candidatus Sericytochromatia bacterium]
MITCPNCQAENMDGVTYCDECGTKLDAPPQSDAPVAGTAASQESGPAARLVITRGGTVGKEFPLERQGETQIGRWDPDGGAFPEVDLTQDDPEAKISRKHARIFLRDGAYQLEDVGSLNGTFINRGSRLMPGSPQGLKDSDEILLGKTFFRFQID